MPIYEKNSQKEAKNTFFVKKSTKYLVMSKKYRTFARFFA